MSRRVWILCVAACLAGLPIPARADLVVTIDSSSVPAGGTGTVDVFVASTGTDTINSYGFDLQIANSGLDGTQLAFSSNQSFGYVNDSSYLFYGDSNAAETSTAAGYTSSSATGYPNDTFLGLDYTADGNPVTLSSGTSYLLASLTVTTATGAPPAVGDTFSVSLVPTSGSGSLFAGSNTYFDVLNSNYQETSYTAFSSNSGTLTIGPASAVPEPASIVSGLAGLVVVASAWGARRLRSSNG